MFCKFCLNQYAHIGSRLEPFCMPEISACDMQRYFGTAVGKNRQAAKTEIEKLKLDELSCKDGIIEIARM